MRFTLPCEFVMTSCERNNFKIKIQLITWSEPFIYLPMFGILNRSCDEYYATNFSDQIGFYCKTLRCYEHS